MELVGAFVSKGLSHKSVQTLRRHRRTALLSAWLVMPLLGIGQSEDFYETRLHAGQEAYRQRLAVDAIDQFRIAAFGFLDRPPLLSEALARLAVAQAALGRSADAAATVSRFIGVEREFAPYAQVKLEADVRSEFQSLLLQRVPQATLLSLPGLAGLVETEEQKIAKLPSRERRKTLEVAFRREPGNAAWPLALAREAAEREAHKEVERWAGEALGVDAGNTEALALRAHARAARRECAEALSDLKALPQAELGARPELNADRFVCLVERKDWAGAEGTLKLIPAKLLLRSDVTKAERELAAERARRNKENAGSAGAATKSSERNGADRLERSTAGPSARGTDRAQDPPPEKKPTGEAASQVSARAREVLAESHRLVATGRAGEAERILIETLKSEGDSRELRLALLEASCLSRAWKRGAEQLPLVSPFTDAEGVFIFYAAVVLYETGRGEEARTFMTRALPKVAGPFVDEYARKILGSL